MLCGQDKGRGEREGAGTKNGDRSQPSFHGDSSTHQGVVFTRIQGRGFNRGRVTGGGLLASTNAEFLWSREIDLNWILMHNSQHSVSYMV